jgi:hypothetical protein
MLLFWGLLVYLLYCCSTLLAGEGRSTRRSNNTGEAHQGGTNPKHYLKTILGFDFWCRKALSLDLISGFVDEAAGDGRGGAAPFVCLLVCLTIGFIWSYGWRALFCH